MQEAEGTVVTVDGMLMCSLCGGEWAEHLPHADDEKSPVAGCIQAIGRRLAELDARTAGIDRFS